ncbi:hypothetical protein DYB32_000343 [Aphanomyces invadans]|uniref:Uncharacterized protein n=1 Tax=Aphanomyces invadans TaxID=157072 RepID=A0A3R6YGZ4_9STRA|nr:hypothetical protein DYB32_000343 [Aphanomyces invadans]
MDRQQEWLRKKAEKAAAEKQRQQDEADKELTFQPALKKPTAPRPTLLATQQQTPTPADTTKARAKSAERHRKPPAGQKPPLKPTSSLLDSVKAELSASAATTNAAVKPDVVSAPPPSTVPATVTTDTAVAMVARALENVGNVRPASAPVEGPVERPFQFDSGSNDSKGRHQLQDPSLFDLTTIYRKKDKFARRDGVSLQMGRRDDTRDEQIIAVLFDREHFATEAEAGEWFDEHKQRLKSYMT